MELYKQYEDIIVTLCVTGLIVFMMFIIYQLARESKAGKFGMFVLFIALGLGMFGFLAKTIIQAALE